MNNVIFSIIIVLLFIYILINLFQKKENFINKKTIPNNNIIFITQFYKPKWDYRFNEIKKCLEKNLNNKYISKIILFCEEDFNFENLFKNNKNLYKIKKVKSDRLTFKKVFNYTNKYYPNEIKVLSNSDIYLDNTIKKIFKINLNKLFIALTRYNENKNIKNDFKLEPSPAGSQDTWIWKGIMKIGPFKDYNEDGIKLGIWGCENRINYIIKNSGYNVRNFCKSIKTYHMHHFDNQRNDLSEKNRYPRPYYLPKIEEIII